MKEKQHIHVENPTNDISTVADAVVDEISRRLMEQNLEAYKEFAK